MFEFVSRGLREIIQFSLRQFLNGLKNVLKKKHEKSNAN